MEQQTIWQVEKQVSANCLMTDGSPDFRLNDWESNRLNDRRISRLNCRWSSRLDGRWNNTINYRWRVRLNCILSKSLNVNVKQQNNGKTKSMTYILNKWTNNWLIRTILLFLYQISSFDNNIYVTNNQNSNTSSSTVCLYQLLTILFPEQAPPYHLRV